MRAAYSYIRLALASWLFVGGIALQFVPSNAAVGREARRRERELPAVPTAERAAWVEARDLEDARSEATYRLLGVLIGGIGFGVALFEAAYVCARSSRHCPLDSA
jgi:hypothetical protein